MAIPDLVVFAAWGFFGAVARIALQMYRDGVWPDSVPRTLGLLFLGVVGGVVGFYLGEAVFGTIALGFMASDVIENLFSAGAPDVPP
jgi:hypothetical protein